MPLKTNFDEQPTINLTPMIDIVFLLIIFFMVGTKFVEMERDIEVNVPRVADIGPLTGAPPRWTINVRNDGRISLNDKEVDVQRLTAELKAVREQYEDLGVVVRGAADGPFQYVAEVLNAVRGAGISEMGISVQPIVR